MIAAPSPPQFEAEVASRFDALEARFKDDVAADDVRLDAILRHLGPIEGRRILDAGCGKGRFAARLEEHGARVLGLDPSAGMLRAAHRRGLPVARASARHLPFTNASVDAVVFVEVLEHIAPCSLEATLREAFRVLRPGGRIVIVDKNAASLDPIRPWLPAILVKRIDERRGRWMYPPGSRVRERWFWPGQMRRRLRRTGFSNIHSEALLDPSERRCVAFRTVPMTRRFVAWSATRSEGACGP
ncbi:class I SAM-dependent methyltransferase [Tautonia marina]|uniref:class I SAM-dependent methyltransferase n=1 Tax=Tautonia marina TaxID=2653855 RepID=UPI001260765F|nr:class I SAM-dependent methyltransferase [Tautonia marina]